MKIISPCIILLATMAAISGAGCSATSAGSAASSLAQATLASNTRAIAAPYNQPSTTTTTRSFYVDCTQASAGDGTETSPWNNLGAANANVYQPGDTIYFKRGTTCLGMFSPTGSGTATAPITVTAYGGGELPVIDGGTANNAAMYLTNQSYWTIEDLALRGGMNWGLVAKALNNVNVYGLTIQNVVASGVTSVAKQRALTGEIGLLADGADNATINDVNISNVSVGDTKAGEGIFIKAGPHGVYYGAKGQNISVTNSKVSNVYGDGLLVTDAQNVTISHNIVTQSGECPDCTGSTPGALWVWNSVNVEISWNESYANTSWAGDGGGIDIDYLNRNVTVEQNYIHDNKGYCVSVFGAGKQVTYRSIVRFNVCSNNAAMPSTTQKGDFLVTTWDGGSLNGVQIYNNTSYWTAQQANDYELTAGAAKFSGTLRNFFANNMIYTPLQHPYLINAPAAVTADHNLYYSPVATDYTFLYKGTVWNSFADYQNGSGQDAHSVLADPLLGDPAYDVDHVWPKDQLRPQHGSPAIGVGADVCAGYSPNVCSMGTVDFFDKPLSTSSLWIGAIQEKYDQQSANGAAHSN
ncbi:MAG TPA: right-handed parallel beta-helix repeat-containing protein [Edaphobacter sp.]|nr:right-handed parallel beta-helix repeat-containing protein [Edaphobacter sp.]